MCLTINIYYTGTNGSAKKFAEEMLSSGLVEQIRAEQGNLKYEYFYPVEQPETVLLVDKWSSQDALDVHHKTPMMKQIAQLRKKYNLKITVEKYTDYVER